LTARVTTLLAAMAIAAVVAGCGGDGDGSVAGASGDGVSPASSITEAEFISQAKEICSSRKRQLLKDLGDYSLAYRGRHPNQTASAHAFPSALRKVGIPGLQAQLDALRALGLPSDDDGRAEAYLNAFQEAIDASRVPGRTTGTQFLREFQKSRDLARSYGIGPCAFG
jgi:hypothetical protein